MLMRPLKLTSLILKRQFTISVSNVNAFATYLLQRETVVAALERINFFLQGKSLSSFSQILAKGFN